MSDDFKQRIDSWVQDAFEGIFVAAGDVDRRASLTGAFNSSRNLIARNEAIRDAFRKSTVGLAKLVEVTSLDKAGKETQLRLGVEKLSKRILERLMMNAGSLGRYPSDNQSRTKLHEDLRHKLTDDADSLCHDFGNGIAWGENIRVHPPSTVQVTIGAIHGGTNQVAAGSVVTQSIVINAALRDFVTAIDAVRASAEYQGLGPDDRQELEAIVEDLKEEAAQPSPAPSRIKRWGERFLSRLKKASLFVAEETLRAALVTALAALAAPSAAQ